MRYNHILLSVLIFTSFFATGQNQIKVTSDFPGGNIVVSRIEGDTVWLEPNLSFTQGKWFYWYFKVSGISGKTVRFQFNENNLFAKYGPAYSINNDETWKWYGENRVENNSFTYTFSQQDTVAYFSVAFPYTEKNLYTFLGNLRNKEALMIDTLCFSPGNRTVEKITIPALKPDPQLKVLITARHHACEMMVGYVLEGMITSLLNDKNLETLRENIEFVIVPFMDKDGVENGEQGKNRIPRDHNRDYDENSVHLSTAALKKFVPTWSEKKLKLALDLHCPWIKGENNEDIYLVGSSNKQIEKNQVIFSQLLEKNSLGEIKSFHHNFLSFGTSWNTGSNYSQGISFAGWASELDGISLATTIEYPYANISGSMVTKDNSSIYGKAIMYSIMDFFFLSDLKPMNH